MLNRYLFYLIICVLLLICGTLPSCTTTEVVSRLPNTTQPNTKPQTTKQTYLGANTGVNASSSNTPSRSVGFQYLFGIIPFGRVKLKDPMQDITISVQRLGALPDPKSSLIELNAFDLFLTRSLSCRVSTILIGHDGDSVQINASHREWSSFGFSLDLSRAWTRCLWNLQEKAGKHFKK